MMLSTRLPLLAGGRFDPRSIGSGSLKLWLDASRLGLNDGDQVATWPDLSGLGNDATQPTASKRPLFKVGQTPTGMPSVRTDGVDDYLQALFTLPQPLTIVTALRMVSVGLASNHDSVLTGGNTSSGLFINSTPNTGIFSNGSFPSEAVAEANGVLAILLFVFNGAGYLRVNGVQKLSGATLTQGMGGVTLGALGNPIGRYTNVDFVAVCAFSRELSLSEQQYVERGLGKQGGVAVS